MSCEVLVKDETFFVGASSIFVGSNGNEILVDFVVAPVLSCYIEEKSTL